MNIAKFLRTAYFVEHLQWLLLNIVFLVWLLILILALDLEEDIKQNMLIIDDLIRSSHQRRSMKKGVLSNFKKFTEDTCVRVFF